MSDLYWLALILAGLVALGLTLWQFAGVVREHWGE